MLVIINYLIILALLFYVWLLMIFKKGEGIVTQSTTHCRIMGDNSSRVK